MFIVATTFTLRDGSEYDGFCSPCDPCGLDYVQPVIVTDAGHLPFWWDDVPAEAPASLALRLLNKPPEAIFPVRFVARVACAESAPFSDVINGFVP